LPKDKIDENINKYIPDQISRESQRLEFQQYSKEKKEILKYIQSKVISLSLALF